MDSDTSILEVVTLQQKQKAAVLHRDLWCRAQPRHLESFTLHSPWPPARQTWLSSHLPSHKFIFVFLTWVGGSFTKTLSFPYAYLDPTGSDGKASACNVGDRGFESWVGKIPWRRKWQSTPALLPGKSHGWRSLTGYSLWGCKESDTTERLHFTSLHFRMQQKPSSL